MNLKKIKDIFENRKPEIAETEHEYALFLPLVEKEGRLHLLYELRSYTLDRQPGEVCFPGGQMEKDETPRQCAVRETCEELGISEADVNVIAEIDTVHNHNNSTMYCFLGTIDYTVIEASKPSEIEVEEIFLVPIDFLMETEPRISNVDIIPHVPEDFPYDLIGFGPDYPWKRGVMKVPVYVHEGKAIWGLTGRITANLIDILKEND